MLTGAELVDMRIELAAAMPSTAAFQRRSTTRNSIGGRENALEPVDGMDAVPCHVHPDTARGSSESEQRGAVVGDQRYRVIFAHGTDARETDVVTIDDDVYQLVSVDTGRSWALEVEAYAVRSR